MAGDGQAQGARGFPNILGLVRATSIKVLGKAGATNGAGLAGGTASGAPTAPAGPFDVGDVIVDASGTLWICSVAGTSQSSPGTLTQVVAGSLSSVLGLALGGTGLAAAPTDGQLLIGQSSDHTLHLATLTAGTGIAITNSGGGISLANTGLGGGGSLSTVSNYLTGDVTLTSANTYYDGPSVSCAAGTWLLGGALYMYNGGSASGAFARLWDGTTVYGEGSADLPAGFHGTVFVSALVTPGTTTTYTLRGANQNTGGKIGQTMNANGTAGKASYLLGVKVA